MIETYYNFCVENYNKYGDSSVVLMQVGSFYEMYSIEDMNGFSIPKMPDLNDICNILGFVKNRKKEDSKNMKKMIEKITKKTCEDFIINMCGFPTIALNKHITTLTENNYNVAVVDEIDEDDNGRKNRKITEIYSSGLYIENQNNLCDNIYIISLYIEGHKQIGINNKNRCNNYLICVGSSAIDVSTGECHVNESIASVIDPMHALDETIRFINSFKPKEIIVSYENVPDENYIYNYLELYTYNYIRLPFIKNCNLLKYQKQILMEVYSESLLNIFNDLNIANEIYCRYSLVRLIEYVKDHNTSLLKNISHPKKYISDINLIIGSHTLQQLDICKNGKGTKNNGCNKRMNKYESLLDIIDKCSTTMGKRYLRYRLSIPFTSIDQLNEIYGIVEVLINGRKWLIFEEILKQISDIEKLFRKLSMYILNPNELYALHDSLSKCIIIFQGILRYFQNEMCSQFSNIENYILCCSNIREYINEHYDEMELQSFKAWSILKRSPFKNGLYGDIEKLEDDYSSNGEYVEIIKNELSNFLPKSQSNITIKHTERDGYYLQITTKRAKMLQTLIANEKKYGELVFEMDEKNSKIRFPDWKSKSKETSNVHDELVKVVKKIHQDHLMIMYDNSKNIFMDVIKCVTMIDYFCNIAKVSFKNNYCKPEIIDCMDGSSFELDGIRHPIVEKIIENDYVSQSLSTSSTNLGHLIYGINSSGKSILMKAVGIIIIMAQSGFYTPCTTFKFYPFRQLFSRLSFDDNLFQGLSTFTHEMLEINTFINRSDQYTMIIGDEICRGTEFVSACSIIASTLNSLCNSRSKFIFTTHIHDVADLDDIKSLPMTISHLAVSYNEITNKIIYDRTLSPGSGNRLYGVEIARSIIKSNDFNEFCNKIKNKITDYTDISSAKCSKYNKLLVMNKCYLCSKSLKLNSNAHTHHIKHQVDFKGDNKFIGHIEKNALNNLMPLCNVCHTFIHSQNIDLRKINSISTEL